MQHVIIKTQKEFLSMINKAIEEKNDIDIISDQIYNILHAIPTCIQIWDKETNNLVSENFAIEYCNEEVANSPNYIIELNRIITGEFNSKKFNFITHYDVCSKYPTTNLPYEILKQHWKDFITVVDFKNEIYYDIRARVTRKKVTKKTTTKKKVTKKPAGKKLAKK